MHRLALLLMSIGLLGGIVYYRNQSAQAKQHTDQSQDEGTKPEGNFQDQAKDKMVKFAGPLAELMDKSQSDNATAEEKPQKPVPLRKPNPADLIAPSPVGTTASIVHKTFTVSSASNFAFQVPPHAASPQLRGSYHSFVPPSRDHPNNDQSNDDPGDVDILLMNDEQYADYIHGHSADVVYSVDSSHEGDVSLGLPATLAQSAQYYLVFRNISGSRARKVVEADFRVDF
jgi:hypothetical protein